MWKLPWDTIEWFRPTKTSGCCWSAITFKDTALSDMVAAFREGEREREGASESGNAAAPKRPLPPFPSFRSVNNRSSRER